MLVEVTAEASVVLLEGVLRVPAADAGELPGSTEPGLKTSLTTLILIVAEASCPVATSV